MGRRGILGLVLCAVIGAASGDGKDGGRKQRRTKGDDIDFDALEKAWEKGDSEQELVTDDTLRMKKMEAARRRQPSFDPSNPEAFVKRGGQSQPSGPVMLFADLLPKQPAGHEWSQNAVDSLAVRWRDMLKTGGIETSVFNIEHNKVLFTIQNGDETGDVKDFLLEQPETDFVTLNSVKSFPPGRSGEERKGSQAGPPEGQKGKPAKRKKRGRKAQADKDGLHKESL